MNLPAYECHKPVRAIIIDRVEHHGDVIYLVPTDKEYDKIQIDMEFLLKHSPSGVVGNYYVVYEDGYQSIIPAMTFDQNFNLIGKEI